MIEIGEKEHIIMQDWVVLDKTLKVKKKVKKWKTFNLTS